MTITRVLPNSPIFEQAFDAIWGQWGQDSNKQFYRNAMENAGGDSLPRFYVAQDYQTGAIIGTYALLTNDLVSRQDLFPWIACLYVREENRGQTLGKQLLEHALSECLEMGFGYAYLTTGLQGYYEKYGWSIYDTGYNIVDEAFPIYRKSTK